MCKCTYILYVCIIKHISTLSSYNVKLSIRNYQNHTRVHTYSTYVAKDLIISKDVFYYKVILNPNISCSQLVLFKSQNRDLAQLINFDTCF